MSGQLSTLDGRQPHGYQRPRLPAYTRLETQRVESERGGRQATGRQGRRGTAPAAEAAGQPTTISTSRGFVDFLATNRLSLALTSYQTGQLMLIGPLLDGRLSVFQRNFVRAMGLWASQQRLYLSTIAQIWRLENVLGAGQLANQQSLHYERLYVPRTSYTTGDIDAHELGIDRATGWSSSTQNIPVSRRSTRCTASSCCGSRASYPRSRPRNTAI